MAITYDIKHAGDNGQYYLQLGNHSDTDASRIGINTLPIDNHRIYGIWNLHDEEISTIYKYITFDNNPNAINKYLHQYLHVLPNTTATSPTFTNPTYINYNKLNLKNCTFNTNQYFDYTFIEFDQTTISTGYGYYTTIGGNSPLNLEYDYCGNRQNLQGFITSIYNLDISMTNYSSSNSFIPSTPAYVFSKTGYYSYINTSFIYDNVDSYNFTGRISNSNNAYNNYYTIIGNCSNVISYYSQIDSTSTNITGNYINTTNSVTNDIVGYYLNNSATYGNSLIGYQIKDTVDTSSETTAFKSEFIKTAQHGILNGTLHDLTITSSNEFNGFYIDHDISGGTSTYAFRFDSIISGGIANLYTLHSSKTTNITTFLNEIYLGTTANNTTTDYIGIHFDVDTSATTITNDFYFYKIEPLIAGAKIGDINNNFYNNYINTEITTIGGNFYDTYKNYAIGPTTSDIYITREYGLIPSVGSIYYNTYKEYDITTIVDNFYDEYKYYEINVIGDGGPNQDFYNLYEYYDITTITDYGYGIYKNYSIDNANVFYTHDESYIINTSCNTFIGKHYTYNTPNGTVDFYDISTSYIIGNITNNVTIDQKTLTINNISNNFYNIKNNLDITNNVNNFYDINKRYTIDTINNDFYGTDITYNITTIINNDFYGEKSSYNIESITNNYYGKYLEFDISTSTGDIYGLTIKSANIGPSTTLSKNVYGIWIDYEMLIAYANASDPTNLIMSNMNYSSTSDEIHTIVGYGQEIQYNGYNGSLSNSTCAANYSDIIINNNPSNNIIFLYGNSLNINFNYATNIFIYNANIPSFANISNLYGYRLYSNSINSINNTIKGFELDLTLNTFNGSTIVCSKNALTITTIANATSLRAQYDAINCTNIYANTNYEGYLQESNFDDNLNDDFLIKLSQNLQGTNSGTELEGIRAEFTSPNPYIIQSSSTLFHGIFDLYEITQDINGIRTQINIDNNINGTTRSAFLQQTLPSCAENVYSILSVQQISGDLANALIGIQLNIDISSNDIANSFFGISIDCTNTPDSGEFSGGLHNVNDIFAYYVNLTANNITNNANMFLADFKCNSVNELSGSLITLENTIAGSSIINGYRIIIHGNGDIGHGFFLENDASYTDFYDCAFYDISNCNITNDLKGTYTLIESTCNIGDDLYISSSSINANINDNFYGNYNNITSNCSIGNNLYISQSNIDCEITNDFYGNYINATSGCTIGGNLYGFTIKADLDIESTPTIGGNFYGLRELLNGYVNGITYGIYIDTIETSSSGLLCSEAHGIHENIWAEIDNKFFGIYIDFKNFSSTYTNTIDNQMIGFYAQLQQNNSIYDKTKYIYGLQISTNFNAEVMVGSSIDLNNDITFTTDRIIGTYININQGQANTYAESRYLAWFEGQDNSQGNFPTNDFYNPNIFLIRSHKITNPNIQTSTTDPLFKEDAIQGYKIITLSQLTEYSGNTMVKRDIPIAPGGTTFDIMAIGITQDEQETISFHIKGLVWANDDSSITPSILGESKEKFGSSIFFESGSNADIDIDIATDTYDLIEVPVLRIKLYNETVEYNQNMRWTLVIRYIDTGY